MRTYAQRLPLFRHARKWDSRGVSIIKIYKDSGREHEASIEKQRAAVKESAHQCGDGPSGGRAILQGYMYMNRGRGEVA